jgi:hypothetical protein
MGIVSSFLSSPLSLFFQGWDLTCEELVQEKLDMGTSDIDISLMKEHR